VNVSAQVGSRLWNVHTVGYSATNSRPTPRFYEIDASASSVVQSGNLQRSLTSDDLNASIVANQLGEAFVTWTSVERDCVDPEVRVAARTATDPLGTMSQGSVIGTSHSYFDMDPGTPEAWGDYSAITLDPSVYGTCGPTRRAWAVNELVRNSTIWGSRFGSLGYC
jgi:hypothetical protein